MPVLEYISAGGYQYRQAAGKSARVVRVAKTDAPVTMGPPKAGDTVRIIIKPYKDHVYVTGIVQRLLTRKKMHTRGFKVMLEDGTVGRMVAL